MGTITTLPPGTFLITYGVSVEGASLDAPANFEAVITPIPSGPTTVVPGSQLLVTTNTQLVTITFLLNVTTFTELMIENVTTTDDVPSAVTLNANGAVAAFITVVQLN